jgi:type IV pilus assembly protein PilQ
MKHIINCLLLLLGVLLVIVIFSPQAGVCASKEPLLKASLDTKKNEDQKKAATTQGVSPARVEKVEISDLKNACRVSIAATQIPTYTVYKLSKPDRIIVDIPGLIVDPKISFPAQLQDSIISGIKGNTIDKNSSSNAHIEILLKQPAAYAASRQGASLFIDITKPQLAAEQKTPVSQEPATPKQPALTPLPPSADAPDKGSSPEKALAKINSINNIKNINISDTLSGYQITISSDAEIKKYRPFTLQNPTRLAIDFPAAICSVTRPRQNMNNALIRTVRIGSDSETVRLVIDFTGPALPKYQITPKGNDLLVMIEAPLKAAVTEKQVAVAVPAKTTALSAMPNDQQGGDAVEKPSSDKNKTYVTAYDKTARTPAKQSIQGKEQERDMPAVIATPPVAAIGAPSESVQYGGQKISLDFKDADIKNILRLISDVSGFNIITSDRVAGRVTLKLENLPWDQALDIILESNNLGKIVAGNIIRIDTQDQILKSQKDKLEQTSLEDLAMETVPVSYVKAKDIERYIKDLKVLSEKRGSINSFEHTNTVTITDVPDKVKRIRELIQEQDIATRQVLIEARIVQSNPNYIKELGVVWGNLYKTTKDGGAAQGGADINVSGAAGDGAVVNLPAAVGLGSGGGINFGYITDSLQLDIQLTALEKDEKLKIVSSPKILGIDNKEARIKQGVALPYLKLSEQGVTSTEFKDAVLELKVTPKITPTNTVNLHVFVTKNQKSAQTGAGGEPGIDIREVETDLLVENGKTVVIGGIYETSKNKIVNKVPFFGSLPFFGYFFRNTRDEDTLTEILVFLTVNIVYQPKVTGQASGEM